MTLRMKVMVLLQLISYLEKVVVWDKLLNHFVSAAMNLDLEVEKNADNVVGDFTNISEMFWLSRYLNLMILVIILLRRFLDNQLEKGERMWHSIQHRPYQRPMVPDPTNPRQEIPEPLSKITEGDKKKYIVDVKVMNYILQAIPNDIYNSVDACSNAHEMWKRIKRLMHGSDISDNVRHLRLMDEFDKFAAKEGESLESVYERMEQICYHGSLKSSWQSCLIDELYDLLVQFEPHVLASRAKKAAKNHDPLALIAHSNASSSHPHAYSSYSPQSYYVTHPLSVVDYDDEYQGELQGDS
ncbi:hypothetical protein Tco_0728133 [Tanacetum coccineum]|uniref:Uncharacterized protein n=1 Tax=Tanacetum coccineum TaxID=301880 RepID=A0ABQ4YMW9_9ASTR